MCQKNNDSSRIKLTFEEMSNQLNLSISQKASADNIITQLAIGLFGVPGLLLGLEVDLSTHQKILLFLSLFFTFTALFLQHKGFLLNYEYFNSGYGVKKDEVRKLIGEALKENHQEHPTALTTASNLDTVAIALLKISAIFILIVIFLLISH